MVVPLPLQGETGIPLFLIEFAEVAHGFLAVQFEEAEAAVVGFEIHYLAAVGLFTTGFAVGTAPGQLPCVVRAKVVHAVQLVVL